LRLVSSLGSPSEEVRIADTPNAGMCCYVFAQANCQRAREIAVR
jgi:hypothetical protein